MNYNLSSAIKSNSTRRRLAGVFGLLLALGLLMAMAFPVPALAQDVPPVPNVFNGSVNINDAPAPVGTIVSAQIGGIDKGQTTVSTAGQYSMSVVGTSDDVNMNISFFVNGTAATTSPNATYKFKAMIPPQTVNLSATIVEPTSFDLTVTASGCCSITAGDLGTVPAGQTVSFNDLEADSTVTLTANLTDCCEWLGWNINSSSFTDNPITVTMNEDVTAIGYCQMAGPYVLTINVTPAEGGTVTANPSSVDGNYDCGTVVTLTYAANEGYQFVSWSGALTGTANNQNLTMDGDKTVTATFVALPPPPDDTIPGAIMSIGLNAGWNTFSIPIKLDTSMDTWSEFLTINELDYEIVWSYNAQSGLWEQVYGTDSLLTLEGYYIKMNAAGNAQIVPYPDYSSQPVKTLYEGLNLVGVASLENVAVDYYLTTVYNVRDGQGYTLVHNPPVNIPNDWNNNIYTRDSSPVPTMEVGKAYWVYMLYPGNLAGFTSTPLP